MLRLYAQGAMPFHVDGQASEQVGWIKYDHRGIQPLDRIDFPKSQRRYIFNPQFEVRYNQAFEEVLEACADRPGKPQWMTSELRAGYLNLHKLGFAHSFETWQDGRLVGGAFGVQIGGFITCESLFYRVSNAAKAAWGQTLLRLRDRGFVLIDTNGVAGHSVNYGEEWVPQWRFEQLLGSAVRARVTLEDGMPVPVLPAGVRLRVLWDRAAERIARRLRKRPASSGQGEVAVAGE